MYKEKIEALFSKMKGMKEIDIHSCVIHPPLEKKKLKSICDEFKIPEALFLFYSEMNGCQLSYTFKSNKDFDKEKFGYYDDAFPAMWPNENYWSIDGCINILAVDFIFKNNWKDYIWFETADKTKITYNHQQIIKTDFEKQLKPFDVFSKNSIAVIYPVNEAGDILLSTDHNASYIDFLPVTIEAYINGIISTGGIIDKRNDIFKISN
jgi:hypothetical protein